MPTVSEFRGIRIEIRYREEGHQPHFHAISGRYEISYNILTREIEGEMPAGKMMYIIIWAKKYRKQIKKNWYRAKFGKHPMEIPGI